jgi:hypothetical protein
MKRFSLAALFAGCVWLGSVTAAAQEVVHALAGTVNDINPSAKTITVFTADGSGGTFKDLANPNTRVDFDKRIRAGSTEINTFDKKGAYAIVFYFGNENARTAVAVRNLGPGPFSESKGTVTKFDGRAHLLSIREDSGKVDSFNISADTVAETGLGAVDGYKFQPQKDEQVQVISSMVNGSATVLFVHAM